MTLLNRRQLLQSAAATSLVTSLGSNRLLAQSGGLRVNTYGGVYERAVNESFIAYYNANNDLSAQALADIPSTAISRIQATMPNPDYDLFIGTAVDTIRAIELEIAEPVDPAKLPSLAQIPDRYREIWQNMGVSFSTGIMGFLYDKRVIPNPPRSWEEFVERTIAGEFGRSVTIPSINASGCRENFIYPVVNAFGGSVENADAGFEKIREMSPYIVRYHSDLAEVLQMMATGEASIALYADGRAWQFVDNGNDWADFIIPTGGGVFSSSQIMKVRGAPEEAWGLMDCFFNAEAAQPFVDIIKYPVVAPVTYEEVMQSRQPAEEDVLYPPYFDIYAVSAAWTDRWNREIGG